MPELPEVIVIRDALKKELVGKKILEIETYENYPLVPSKKQFDDFVVDKTITGVSNTAKMLVISLSSGYHICIHLRMTGNVLYNTKDKYTKISFKLSSNNVLNYSSIRKLGYLELWNSEKLNNYSKRFGKTVLESNLEADEFINLTKNRRKSIRNTLLDQKIVSGVGNIYAHEALFLTKIHPKTMTNSLNENKLKTLFKNLKKVLKKGIKLGGSSIDRYKNAYGESGNQQNHFLVYGKKGKKCDHCKVGVIKYEKFQGRGIYYCSECQKL